MRNQNTRITKTLHGTTRTAHKSRTLQLALASLATIGSLLCLTTSNAYSAIITASTCSSTDIQTAVNSARTGDTVEIPEGNCSIAGTITIPAGVTLAGAGETRTILTKAGTSTKHMVTVDCSNGEHAIVHGITLIGTGDEVTEDNGLELRNNCQDFQVFNSTFKNFGRAGVTIRGNARGVIYHSSFIKNYKRGLGYGVELVGDGTWPALDLGTENAVFVEDSYLEGSRHTISSNNGSRYVFRYNTIVDNREDAAAIDAHGKTVWPRGSRSYEIYNNSIANSIKRWAGAGIRGGDGVIFNNTISGTSHPIMLFNDSSLTQYGGCTTYPCPDQTRELYIWDNTQDGTTANVSHWHEIDKLLIQEGRDYFLYPRPGYTPYPYPHPLAFQFDDAQPPMAPQGLRILP